MYIFSFNNSFCVLLCWKYSKINILPCLIAFICGIFYISKFRLSSFEHMRSQRKRQAALLHRSRPLFSPSWSHGSSTVGWNQPILFTKQSRGLEVPRHVSFMDVLVHPWSLSSATDIEAGGHHAGYKLKSFGRCSRVRNQRDMGGVSM